MAVAQSIRCRVCWHPQRLQIEQELARGRPVREVASAYRLPADRLVTHYVSHARLAGAVVGEQRRKLRW